VVQILHARPVMPLEARLTELVVSRTTFKRDMEYLRERLHAPIVWDRSERGYRLDGGHALGPVYELPGLWFSASELCALLTAHKLLADIEPGLLERKRLEVVAWSRGRDAVNSRVITPQRLVHCRDNWYLDAWCHWRNGLRSFAVDALQQVQVLDVAAQDVPTDTLDAHHASAYGIFSGAVIA